MSTGTPQSGFDVIPLARAAMWAVAAALSLAGLYLLLSDAGLLSGSLPDLALPVAAGVVLVVLAGSLAELRRRNPPSRSFDR